jgi:peptide/nickel transport system permease protein
MQAQSPSIRIRRKKSRLRSLAGFLAKVFRPKSAKAGLAILIALVLMVVLGTAFIPFSPYQNTPQPNHPPSSTHLFGTDFQGRDVLSEVVWGAYPSLSVSIYAALGATLLGFFVGILSGYYQKLYPTVGGATDVVMAIPLFPLLILLGLILISNASLIGIVLIAVLWAPVARSVRSQVQSVKKLAFVDSAKTSGLGDLQIVFKVMVYEVAPLAIAYFITNVSLNIVLVTALQFIGMGNPLLVSWGTILYWAQQYGFNAGDWWWILFPGLIISLTTTGFGLIGFSIEEIANPRLRSSS